MVRNSFLGLISIVLLHITLYTDAHLRFEMQQPIVPTTPVSTGKSNNDETRGVTVQHVTNYSISFVPLISLILKTIPKLVNRISSQLPLNRTQQGKAINNAPNEFSGRNPCIDSILTKKQYPGSHCHFYQCVLYQPASVKCLLQVVEDSRIGDTAQNSRKPSTYSFVTSVRISECLSIKIYKCVPGHFYSSQLNHCVKNRDNFNKSNDVCGK